MQLLKSSVMITEESKILLLDPEHYSEEFKAKVYAILKKGNLSEDQEKITSHSERLFGTDSSGAEPMAVGSCDKPTGIREDLLPDVKTLRTDEKSYIVHLTCVHLQLAHQRNQLLHWFYIPAMVALAGRSCKERVPEGMFVFDVVDMCDDCRGVHGNGCGNVGYDGDCGGGTGGSDGGIN